MRQNTILLISIFALLTLSIIAGCSEWAGGAFRFKRAESESFQQCLNVDCAGMHVRSTEYRQCSRDCADKYRRGELEAKKVVAEIPHEEEAAEAAGGSAIEETVIEHVEDHADAQIEAQEVEPDAAVTPEPETTILLEEEEAAAEEEVEEAPEDEIVVDEESESSEPATTGRLQPSSLVYRGAFRLPDGGTDETGWLWGGTAATYYPDGDADGPNDGYPGSLFATGHEWNQYVSEVSIPAPANSRDIGRLPTAKTIQGFRDIRLGLFPDLEQPRVALQYLPKQGLQTRGKLYMSRSAHQDEMGEGPSIIWAETDLSNPQMRGPWSIDGRRHYLTTDYMFTIPDDFANTYLGGKKLATGRFRDGGQAAQGPSIIAIAPWKQGNPPTTGTAFQNTPLLLYSSVYDEDPEAGTVDGYCPSSWWSGGAWLTSASGNAVIFAGRRGTGECWYGFSDGTSWYTYGVDTDWRDGPDVEGLERGWWADEFRVQILFYDPSDLAAVATGTMETWEPQPYAVLDIEEYMFNDARHSIRQLGSVAYDRENGLLYILEHLGDTENDRPIVHVWRII